jgi:hypothetical protein
MTVSDRQIDQFVRRLFGFARGEFRHVEETTAQ